MGTLYVVATPIGNLEDFSPRALRVLKEVDLILAEDTRVTKKLLSHFKIETPITSYHTYTDPRKLRTLVAELETKNLALVSDAGTPGISDPGARFVAELISETRGRGKVVTIPGPSAVPALLAVSGLYADSYVFHGFPPHKKGRMSFWKQVADEPRTSVFYESPHRVEKAMAELAPLCNPDRRIVIGRELTKMFESVRYGTMKTAVELLMSEPVKGEYVIVVEGR